MDKQQKNVLAAAMITAVVTTFMGSSLNLSIPSLEQYFGVNATQVSWIVSSYSITVAAMSLPFGKVADLTGRRRVFLLGIGGFGLLSLASIFAPHIGILILLRSLSGVAAAMIFATNNAILISAFPHNKQGKVLGYSVAATYIGLTLGPVAGGVLNRAFGWRSIFAVAVLISLAAFGAAFGAVPKDGGGRTGAKEEAVDRGPVPDSDEPVTDPTVDSTTDSTRAHPAFDAAGVGLYVAAIICSLVGMTGLGTNPMAPVLLVAGIGLLVTFFYYESRREAGGKIPVMSVGLFRGSRTFTFSNLAALLNYGATFAISYEISIYLQVVRGITSDKAGLMMIIMPAMQALFSPMMGSLSDRIRPSILASSGMGICALTLVMYAFIHEDTSLALVMGVLALTGLGFALFSSPNTNAILSCVSSKDYGVTNSIIATMRTYGQSAGMAILSMITALTLGTGTLENSPTADVLHMMHVSFLIFSVICVVGLFFSLARDRG